MRASRCQSGYLQRQRRRLPQQGQVILFTMLLLGIVVAVSLYRFVGRDNGVLEGDAQTERALALAKDALIGYASARPTDKTDRPGELPCPDMNNNGQSDDGQCDTVATQIGRFPWVTLRTPDLRDASGERLWYAVSNNFQDNPRVVPLNSNTPGQLTITGISSTSNAVAIVFAPGSVVAGQNRSASNVNNVTHYLEGENANGDTVFTTSASSSTFNDKLLAITPSMFFPAVEMKAARELRSTLNSYYRIHRYFPPASAFDSSCASPNQGIILTNPATCGLGHSTWTPQPWFVPNQWDRLLFYAVAPACADTLALDCTGSGGFLSVNGLSGIRAVVIAPGRPYPGQARPCASISDCLEPPNTTSFPAFTHTTGSITSNDRVVIVAP